MCASVLPAPALFDLDAPLGPGPLDPAAAVGHKGALLVTNTEEPAADDGANPVDLNKGFVWVKRHHRFDKLNYRKSIAVYSTDLCKS